MTSTNMERKPSLIVLDMGFVDARDAQVEITIDVDGKTLWVNVDGICRLRAYNCSVKVEQR